jgi:hypothetical protein
MAWGSTDIRRSIARYLSLMWDKDSGWEIRIARQVVADDARPVAVVLLGDGRTLEARTARDQGYVTEAWPVTIYAYPPVLDDEEAASAAADEIKDLLGVVFTLGLSPDEDEAKEDPAWVEKAGPFRIPLWDYSGIALDKPGPAEPHGVIWVDVSSLSKRNLEDPEDGKRRSVVVEFRASIQRPGRQGPTGPVVGSIKGGFKPVP